MSRLRTRSCYKLQMSHLAHTDQQRCSSRRTCLTLNRYHLCQQDMRMTSTLRTIPEEHRDLELCMRHKQSMNWNRCPNSPPGRGRMNSCHRTQRARIARAKSRVHMEWPHWSQSRWCLLSTKTTSSCPPNPLGRKLLGLNMKHTLLPNWSQNLSSQPCT